MMTNKLVCILDYGSGNVGSVFNIVKSITNNTVVSNSTTTIRKASHIILPGVGAFGTSMAKIKKNIPLSVLEDKVLIKRKPFLGICVGMQVLANKGLEFGEHQGLGWVTGMVRQLRSGKLPLPHIGWNNIIIKQKSDLITRFNSSPDFYFVHSYVFEVKEPTYIVAKTSYGENFISIIQKDNICGVQFHPEKSQKAGKILLENFLKQKE